MCVCVRGGVFLGSWLHHPKDGPPSFPVLYEHRNICPHDMICSNHVLQVNQTLIGNCSQDPSLPDDSSRAARGQNCSDFTVCSCCLSSVNTSWKSTFCLGQGGYVLLGICLSVFLSLCQQDNSKIWQIFVKFFEWLRCMTSKNWL